MSKRWDVRGAVVLGLLGILVGSVPTRAQSGFCLTGCAPDRDYILNHKVQEKNHGFNSDRYWLWIKPQEAAVSALQITTDNNFDGQFNTRAIEVNSRTANKSYPVGSVTWEEDIRTLTITLDKPLPAQEEIEIVLSQVLNPYTEGLYKLNARVLGTEPNPLFRYAGTWTLSIE